MATLAFSLRAEMESVPSFYPLSPTPGRLAVVKRLVPTILLVLAVLVGGILSFPPRRSAPSPAAQPPTGPAGHDPRPTEADPAGNARTPGAQQANAPVLAGVAETTRMALRAGQPLRLAIPGERERRLALRPSDVIAEAYRTSLGPDGATVDLPVEAWQGRELLPGGLGPRVTLAFAGDSLAMHVDDPGGALHVRSSPEDPARLLAGRQVAPPALAEPGPVPRVPGTILDRWAASGSAPRCTLHAPEGKGPTASAVSLPPGAAAEEVVFDRVASLEPIPSVAGEVVTSLDSQTVVPRGRAYDLSLPDLQLLFVLDKATTGSDTSNAALGAKVSTYLALAATVAGVYEEQLGLRLRLQEIILNPNTAAYTNPGTTLDEFATWLGTHRDWFEHGWSHASRFGLVAGTAGGTIGRAYVGTAGTPWGLSENETTYGFTLLTHELGHSVGSSHTSGGVMNASFIANQRNFFRVIEGGTITGALEISTTMADPGLTYGDADLRDASQIPFGQDDFVTTPANTPVTFAPLANDFSVVPGGNANTLRLVEVSHVHPASAGTATMSGDSITFTPAPGFAGVAWFSYTLGGDVGRGGRGWLHRGDVAVTVGGNTTTPPVPPALLVQDDLIFYDPVLDRVAFNPLVNDLGPGDRHAGEVPQVLGPAGPDLALVGSALQLTGVTLVQGAGGGGLGALPMTIAGQSVPSASGVVYYEPADVEPDDIVLTYTVRDATGATGGATITLVPGEYVNVFAAGSPAEEGLLAGTFTITPTTPRGTALTVPFRLSGEATPGTDFTMEGASSFDATTRLGTVVLAAGASSATVSITAIDDALAEGTESVNLAVLAATDVEPGAAFVATLGLSDDESPDTFTELFSGSSRPFDLAGRSLVFVPHATRGYRRFISNVTVTAFPVDPAGATTLAMADDSFATVDLASGRSFPFGGQSRTRLFLGSNGYVTFGGGDTTVTESLDNHFNRARISLLFDDLDPSAGGRVSRQQLEDRWVATFENVPEWNTARLNSFQVELFFDGTIRMTWLRVDATDGLAGLSSGGGTPASFTPSDLSSSLSRTPGVPGLLPLLPVSGALEEGGLPGGIRLMARDAPTAPVAVTLAAASQLSPAESTTQLVDAEPVASSLVAIDDGVAEGDHSATVAFSLVSDDLAYDGMVVPSLLVPILDNAAPSLSVASPAVASLGVPSSALALLLDAEAGDDGRPSDRALQVEWTVVSGTEGSPILSVEAGRSLARFPEAGGRWVLRATASDGSSSTSRDFDVAVGAASIAAAADARPVAAGLAPRALGAALLDLPFEVTAEATGAQQLAWEALARPVPGAKASFAGTEPQTVTLGSPGEWTLRVAGSNAAGTVLADLVIAVSPADLASWSASVFADLPGGTLDPLAADDADADGDGIPNLLEFALRTDPRAPEPAEGEFTIDTADRLGWRVRRVAGGGTGDLVEGYTALGVTLVAEVTSDFITWSRGPTALEESSSPEPDGTGGETVILKARTPLTEAPQFIRLVATRAP